MRALRYYHSGTIERRPRRANIDFAAAMPDVATRLLGERNKRLSSQCNWRFGSKGSLSVNLSNGTWFDHEAAEGGGVLDLVQRHLRCDIPEAIEFIVGDAKRTVAPRPPAFPASTDAERVDAATRLWREARNPIGTVVELYLTKRSIELTSGVANEAIRFHPACPFGVGERQPCMVALMRDLHTNEPVGIHRTALGRDGNKISRKMLGRSKAAAIKLSGNAEVRWSLGVCEGIETGLSVMRAGWTPVWALASAGAIEQLPVLPAITELTIFADHDKAGLKAARSTAQRWANNGRDAFVQVPPAPGADFNNLISAATHAP